MKSLRTQLKTHQSQLGKLSLVLAAAALVTACNDSDSSISPGETSAPVAITFSSGSATSSLSTMAANTTGNLTLDLAKIRVDEMEFESDLEDDGIADDSLEFETEPFIVELGINGSSTTVQNTLPIGGPYNEIETSIEPLEDNAPLLDSAFVDSTGTHYYSIVAKGTYNDAAFTFHSDVELELEVALNTPLLIEANTPINVDIVVNTNQWFVDANGNSLDPTLEENRAVIEQNIRTSFQAIDNDNDGDDLHDND